MTREPVALTGAIVALITAGVSLLTAFGLDVSPEQTAAIIGVVVGVSGLVGAFLARRKVTPVAKVG